MPYLDSITGFTVLFIVVTSITSLVRNVESASFTSCFRIQVLNLVLPRPLAGVHHPDITSVWQEIRLPAVCSASS